MLDNPQYFECGMCIWAADLAGWDVITIGEYRKIESYIEGNRPSNAIGAYYWAQGEIEPRIEWIKYHISIN